MLFFSFQKISLKQHIFLFYEETVVRPRTTFFGTPWLSRVTRYEALHFGENKYHCSLLFLSHCCVLTHKIFLDTFLSAMRKQQFIQFSWSTLMMTNFFLFFPRILFRICGKQSNAQKCSYILTHATFREFTFFWEQNNSPLHVPIDLDSELSLSVLNRCDRQAFTCRLLYQISYISRFIVGTASHPCVCVRNDLKTSCSSSPSIYLQLSVLQSNPTKQAISSSTYI